MGEREGLHGVGGTLRRRGEGGAAGTRSTVRHLRKDKWGLGGGLLSPLFHVGEGTLCPGGDEGQGASRGPSLGHSAGGWGPDPWVSGLSLPRWGAAWGAGSLSVPQARGGGAEAGPAPGPCGAIRGPGRAGGAGLPEGRPYFISPRC